MECKIFLEKVFHPRETSEVSKTSEVCVSSYDGVHDKLNEES